MLSKRFEQALQLAHVLHADQTRKGSEIPYMTHLMAVSAIVGEHGGSEDAMIAALLHDAVEDQGGQETADRIRDAFGDTIAEWVGQCSDTTETPKPPWRARKEAFIGILNGMLWAVVIALLAWLWFQDVGISLVIAAAIVINLIAAAISGIAIPLVLQRINIDPALSGAVILTTVTDVVGFMSFLGLATYFLL